MRAGDDFASISITAVDADGNRVDDYVGTVLLSSTDQEAILPLEGIVQFEPRNLGKKPLTLGLAFNTPGEHWLRAEDSQVQDIEGMIGFNVVGQVFTEVEKLISIVTPLAGSHHSTTEIQVKGNGPPFINLDIIGGTEPVEGETDSDGFFSVTVNLDPNQVDHMIKAQDESGKYESEEVTFTIDVSPPEAISVTFTPENPEEEKDVLLVVESEPDLKTATMTLEEIEYPLTVVGEDSGKYQVLFTSPIAGVYSPTITLIDELGNTLETTVSFPVALKGLPTVQNVIATAEANAIALNWDEITTVPVDAYRIYVGIDPYDFLYTLDTDRPTTSATVAGLKPGTTYYFGVTALEGERESVERSEIIPATVLGVSLEITPQDSALLLEWTTLGDDTPLSSYLLEYGVEEGNLTEKRTLNGELEAFTLRDLINDLSYFVKITPITTTGDVLEDFAANGEGIPESLFAGFRASAADPIPDDFIGHTVAPERPTRPSDPAPRTPEPPLLSEEGVPVPLWTIAVAIAVAMFMFHLHRKRQREMQAFFEAVGHQYN
jgi:hypothetical protein